jgi:hypothetical protein
MKWAGNVKLMGKNINAYRLVVGKLKAETYLEDLDVDGRIHHSRALKSILVTRLCVLV